MLSILALIFIMIGLFKLTGLFFRAVGTLLGWIFGGIGWLILAGLAVTVFGLALIAVPAVLVIGLVALIAAAASCFREDKAMYEVYDRNKEIREAIRAGERALDSLQEANRQLNSAGNWGLVDIFGGNTISGLMKHMKVNNASRCVDDAR